MPRSVPLPLQPAPPADARRLHGRRVTDDAVIAACEYLGGQVSVRNVQTLLGGGSLRDIAPRVKAWRDARATGGEGLLSPAADRLGAIAARFDLALRAQKDVQAQLQAITLSAIEKLRDDARLAPPRAAAPALPTLPEEVVLALTSLPKTLDAFAAAVARLDAVATRLAAAPSTPAAPATREDLAALVVPMAVKLEGIAQSTRRTVDPAPALQALQQTLTAHGELLGRVDARAQAQSAVSPASARDLASAMVPVTQRLDALVHTVTEPRHAADAEITDTLGALRDDVATLHDTTLASVASAIDSALASVHVTLNALTQQQRLASGRDERLATLEDTVTAVNKGVAGLARRALAQRKDAAQQAVDLAAALGSLQRRILATRTRPAAQPRRASAPAKPPRRGQKVTASAPRKKEMATRSSPPRRATTKATGRARAAPRKKAPVRRRSR